ncbi:flagellar hook-basal body complex protein FliE [Pontiella agarivorans]|uniref:Flagellar hook-basal body complex protein FliE n=1 Tax=Pontiella agarivorans TaxID=3038953 RepID=A0ABU5MSV2_9BACT|nr:flagellar hook-basal body complex protein FliE [Pontiella agarivorans]MDZ8117279.1 flagellar hook-basal body complex protein FliE [Pontiella agarivorans]
MDISALSLNGPSQLGPLPGAAARPVAPAAEQGFGDILTNLVDKVDGMQKAADASVGDVVSGKVTDVHQVAVKVQEAGVAFDLMLGVRNRLMDAYQELIKMQA